MKLKTLLWGRQRSPPTAVDDVYQLCPLRVGMEASGKTLGYVAWSPSHSSSVADGVRGNIALPEWLGRLALTLSFMTNSHSRHRHGCLGHQSLCCVDAAISPGTEGIATHCGEVAGAHSPWASL